MLASARKWLRLGPAVVACVALAVLAVIAFPDDPAAVASYGPAHLTDAVLLAAELICSATVTWLAFGTALNVLGVLHGRDSIPARLAHQITPRLLRRLVICALGGAIALSPAPAGACPAHDPREPTLSGLRLPDRPDSTQNRRVDHVVRPGDTLWDIATAQLPSSASAERKVRATRRWYAANRGVIGPDPDVLLPRTRLTAPSDWTES